LNGTASGGERHFAVSGRGAALGAAPGEDHHGRHALLEARRGIAQHEHRPRLARADQAQAGPEEQRAADAIAPAGQEHHAFAARPGLVQRLLDRGGIVGLAIAHRAHGDRLGIAGRLVEHRRAVGLRRGWGERDGRHNA
jgi:hypothetical protein